MIGAESLRRARVGREVRARRAAAPQTGYRAARNEFRGGDVLLFRGRGFASLVIRWLTRSPYSHVGLVFRFSEHVYCLEAVGSGVRLILVSEVLRRYHGGIDYYAVREASDAERQGAIAFCMAQLGRLYDKPGIWRFLVAILFGRTPSVREDRSWFCSELVAAAYRTQGRPLTPASAAYTSPADLALSSELELRVVLRRE